ncbi:hypothetical protein HK101_007519 [Irineochytrium annulatum]|nr:hypothetical protein HK101_007519 [Irineochytrium annulatum]
MARSPNANAAATMDVVALLSLLLLAPAVLAKTYFKETFDSDDWRERWIHSKSTPRAVHYLGNLRIESSNPFEYGSFNVASGKFHAEGAEHAARGLHTTSGGTSYAIAAAMDEVFDSVGKNLVLQYSVKFGHNLGVEDNRAIYAVETLDDLGDLAGNLTSVYGMDELERAFGSSSPYFRCITGLFDYRNRKREARREGSIACVAGYLKLLPTMEPTEFSDDTPYNILFGPELCGFDKWISLNVNYRNSTRRLVRKRILWSDRLTHLYTLIIRPDQTYQVLLNGTIEATGSLMDAVPPKIRDPSAVKPSDWVDQPTILNPDYESFDGPIYIDDPTGPFKRMNPEYRDTKRNKLTIPNPAYKGKWVAPEIGNPDYGSDKDVFRFKTSHVGFEFFQPMVGTIFDNIIVTDSVEEARAFAEETYYKHREGEMAAKAKLLEEEKRQERATIVWRMNRTLLGISEAGIDYAL